MLTTQMLIIEFNLKVNVREEKIGRVWRSLL